MNLATNPAIAEYQAKLSALKAAGQVGEGQTRRAFGRLLEVICDQRDLLFVEEFPVGKHGRRKVDGAIQDAYSSLGYWEAKDENDDLDSEIKRKIAAGYPLSNISVSGNATDVIVEGCILDNARSEIRVDGETSGVLLRNNKFIGAAKYGGDGLKGAVVVGAKP